MITKVVAAIILWLLVSLVLAVFIMDGKIRFLQAWIMANIGLCSASLVVLILDYILPWAFAALFGGSI